MNEDLIKQYMEVDWQFAFQGPSRAGLRADLMRHLDALLEAPMDQIALNGPLVAQAQEVLVRLPPAQRVYNGILASQAVTALPEFRISEIGGPNVNRVMVRSSGQSLSDGIPGIYTYDGFNTVFLNEALGVASRIQKESFVLGEAGAAQQSDTALDSLSRDVLDLYYDDFIKQYETLLGDIDIVPMSDLSRAVEVTQVLSGPTSPIRNILVAISDQTKLTEDRRAVKTEEAASDSAAVIVDDLLDDVGARKRQIIEALQRAAKKDGVKPKPPGAPVEERFAFLHRLVDASKPVHRSSTR